MKRIISYLPVLVVLFLLAMNNVYGEVSFGLKGGISVMNMVGEESSGENNESITGFSFGVFLTSETQEGFAFQPELLLVSKGTKADYSPYFIAVEKDRITYLEIPLLTKYIIPAGGGIGISLFAGGSLGLLLGATYELTGIDAYYIADLLGISTTGTYEDLGVDMNSIEFSLVFGFDVGFELPQGMLIIDLRYDLGLTSAYDTNLTDSVKNRGIIIMAGYSF